MCIRDRVNGQYYHSHWSTKFTVITELRMTVVWVLLKVLPFYISLHYYSRHNDLWQSALFHREITKQFANVSFIASSRYNSWQLLSHCITLAMVILTLSIQDMSCYVKQYVPHTLSLNSTLFFWPYGPCFNSITAITVSYTHLDVYKRQR